MLRLNPLSSEAGSDCLFEVSNPLHKQKLRLSRTIGDYHMKWTCSSDSAQAPGDAVRGSYSCPLIRAQGVSTPDGAAPPCVRLLPPAEQPVSSMSDVIVRPRDLTRFVSRLW